MYRCLAAAVAAAALAVPAAAQSLRAFPQNALRGTLVVQQVPSVLLNKEPARLSPAVRIRGQNNLLQFANTLTGQKLVVNYTADPVDGLIREVWVLTPDEAARQPWPTTMKEAESWSFNPANQVWTKP